jgi:cell division protease FtsH
MVLNSTIRQVIFWVVIIGGAILLYQVFHNTGGNAPKDMHYSELMKEVTAQRVADATVEKDRVTGTLQSGAKYTTKLLGGDFAAADVAKEMAAKGVNVKYEQSAGSSIWMQVAITYLPFLLIFGFWIFMLRQMQSGGNKALSFGKSRAKLLSNQQKRVTFQGSRGRRRSQRRAAGDYRISQGAAKVPKARRQDSQGRFDGGTPGNR